MILTKNAERPGDNAVAGRSWHIAGDLSAAQAVRSLGILLILRESLTLISDFS
jgi:hypothetical protein